MGSHRLSSGVKTAPRAGHLARALYADPDVLLLDDVFAPLDPDRAQRVAADVLGADGPTRVFVTSRLEIAQYADWIILIDRDTLMTVISAFPSVALQILRGYNERLAETTERLASIQMRVAESPLTPVRPRARTCRWAPRPPARGSRRRRY